MDGPVFQDSHALGQTISWRQQVVEILLNADNDSDGRASWREAQRQRLQNQGKSYHNPRALAVADQPGEGRAPLEKKEGRLLSHQWKLRDKR